MYFLLMYQIICFYLLSKNTDTSSFTLISFTLDGFDDENKPNNKLPWYN